MFDPVYLFTEFHARAMDVCSLQLLDTVWYHDLLQKCHSFPRPGCPWGLWRTWKGKLPFWKLVYLRGTRARSLRFLSFQVQLFFARNASKEGQTIPDPVSTAEGHPEHSVPLGNSLICIYFFNLRYLVKDPAGTVVTSRVFNDSKNKVALINL